MMNGEIKYGMKPEELGPRSIRSGAAMALADPGGPPDSKIMMLGPCRSNAFLKYIRPQTLEWGGSTSSEMARTPAFLAPHPKHTVKEATATDTTSTELEEWLRFGSGGTTPV